MPISQVLRENKWWNSRMKFGVGCPGAQSLVCCDLGNALLEFLWKMEVPPVADITAHYYFFFLIFFPWILILLWKNPLVWCWLFFSRSLLDSHMPHKWLSGSPLGRQRARVSSGDACCPPMSVSACLSSVCAVVDQWLGRGLSFWATIILSGKGKESGGEA